MQLSKVWGQDVTAKKSDARQLRRLVVDQRLKDLIQLMENWQLSPQVE